jgi:hypothetical protein
MARSIDAAELSAILTILTGHSELSIDELKTLLPIKLSERTLQRRLAILLREKKIIAVGSGVSRKYQCTTSIKDKKHKCAIQNTTQNKAILHKIKRPLTARVPVGYNPDFLLSYEPNKNFYLTEKIRAHLHNIGQLFHEKLEPGTYAKRILHRLLIDLSWNSSRLEGNTYSLLETEQLLAFGAEASGKDAFETQMILNHKNAIEFMIENVTEFGFTKYFILNIHALLSDGLLANPLARGYLRKIPVGIGRTVYTPLAVPQLIEDYFLLILEKAKKIQDPFEQAFFLMVQLPYLQPFEDVNKRVSRLAANIPLVENNLAPLSFVDVPKDDYISGLLAVYELNNILLLRDVFVWAYERSAEKYKLAFDVLVEPNIVMMQYRKILFELVNTIVYENLHGRKIITCIEQWSRKHIEAKHQAEFIRHAEKEIASLHEGNIAVYRISLDLFSKWNQK